MGYGFLMHVTASPVISPPSLLCAVRGVILKKRMSTSHETPPMSDYLSYTFSDSADLVSTFDEMPLWSAPFGMFLLRNLELRRDMTVIDLGCGTGFPLFELAERLGKSATLYGIDPWANAMERARQKMKNYGITNVTLLETSAEHIPLADSSVDLVISNLGINNFENSRAVFGECYRVLKSLGKLTLTTNITGHWSEFYNVFYATLTELGLEEYTPALRHEEHHRGTIDSLSAQLVSAGFRVNRIIEDSFEMRFLDGSAFLNHHFVKLGWLASWTTLFPPEQLPHIFATLEKNLNAYSDVHHGLTLTVPMAFVEGVKD
jgi:arsenite methyltransferase